MSIREQHSFKIDIHPKTLADAYKMLSAHTPHNNNNYQKKQKKENRTTNTNINSNNNEETANTSINTSNTEAGTSYLQTNAIPRVDGRLISHITCYNCKRKGHYADNCPEQNNNETNNQQHIQTRDTNNNSTSNEEMDTNEQMLQLEGQDGEEDIVHFTWNQIKVDNGLKYKDTDILIDTGSTFLVFKNTQMLLNIRESEREMKAYTNGGRQDSTLVGDLPGF